MKKTKSQSPQPVDKRAPSGVLSIEAKLALTSGSLTALYALPQLAMAAPVLNTTALTVSLPFADSVDWDVDGIGGAEFQLMNSDFADGPGAGLDFYGDIDLQVNASAGLVQKTGQTGGQFQKLSSGFVVGNTLAAGYQFGNSNTLAKLATAYSNTYGAGPTNSSIVDAVDFLDGTSGFFGFSFEDAAGIHFGWAELTIDLDLDLSNAEIGRWCYGSDVGESVTVGSCTFDAPSDVPEPTIPSLVLLGMGAMGVQRWRTRRKAQQAAAA